MATITAAAISAIIGCLSPSSNRSPNFPPAASSGQKGSNSSQYYLDIMEKGLGKFIDLFSVCLLAIDLITHYCHVYPTDRSFISEQRCFHVAICLRIHLKLVRFEILMLVRVENSARAYHPWQDRPAQQHVLRPRQGPSHIFLSHHGISVIHWISQTWR